MKKISIAMPVFNGNEKIYLNKCIDTGWVSANGQYVKEFQNQFASYCGTKYGLACANGTVSLHLALKALNIGPGDEVIMPVITYIATANVVIYCGAKPVFVDVDPETWNIDTKKIEEAITARTKAIIPVHLYGLPCDMTRILEISQKYGLYVIEDAAEAHGAMWNNRRVGSFGTIASFSFFGNKLITCGEGGIVITEDEDIFNRMKLLHSQGVDPDKRYWHIEVGYNYRMTNMQAAIGLGQLENIEWHLEQRKRVANLYQKYLLPLSEYIEFQKVPSEAVHSYWMFCILLKRFDEKHRDHVMNEMEKRGIEMRPLFYPITDMPPYYDECSEFPSAENIATRGICLPTHAMLSDEDIRYICKSLEEILVN